MNQKRQFYKNLTINSLNFLVNVMLGLVLTPFLVQNLGLSSFGIVQLSLSIAIYTAILSSSLNQANNRYISISIEQDNTNNTNSLLTTIFILYIGSFLLILPFIFYIALNPEFFFDIPNDILSSTSYLFILVGLSQIFIMFTAALMSPLYALNRLDIIQYISILRNTLKLIFIFIFIFFISNSLTSVGLAIFFSSLIAIIVSIVSFRYFTPYYKFKLSDFNKDKAIEIFKFSGWTGINSIGVLMFLQTDIILINIFLGAEKSGVYAVLMQWTILLISISTILSVVASPIILIKYSQQKFEELKSFLYRSIKYQGMYIAIPSIIIFVYADTLLTLWLGKEYANLSIYLQLMVFHFGLSQSIRQLYTMNTAYNKVKKSGLVTVLFGIFHILFSIILLNYTDLGILSVILSNVLFTLILNIIFLPLYVSNYIGESANKFYKSFSYIILTQLIVLSIAYLFRYIFNPQTPLALFFVLSLTLLVILFCIYMFLLGVEEKNEVKNILIKASRRKKLKN